MTDRLSGLNEAYAGLAAKLFSEGLSDEEEAKMEEISAEIDRIEMEQQGPRLDRIEGRVYGFRALGDRAWEAVKNVESRGEAI